MIYRIAAKRPGGDWAWVSHIMTSAAEARTHADLFRRQGVPPEHIVVIEVEVPVQLEAALAAWTRAHEGMPPNGVVPERLDIENGRPGDHDAPYRFTAPYGGRDLGRWLDARSRYTAGAFAWEFDEQDERNRLKNQTT